MSDALWIFGYGSLVWRPAFDHRRRLPAYVDGWARRFWQGSTDHRGVPGSPGRVVTLIPQAEHRCWGTVYEVAPKDVGAVLARLDHREQGGYVRHELAARGGDESEIEAVTYLASPKNPNWLGEAPLSAIAAQIRASRGPSGPNLDYVLRLDEALTEMGVEDAHVRALVRELGAQTG